MFSAHHWAFDGAGLGVDQPAEPKPFCRKVKIGGYPTEEYLGLIFAYFGEGEAPPLPRYSHFESEGVLQVDSCTRQCAAASLPSSARNCFTRCGPFPSPHQAQSYLALIPIGRSIPRPSPWLQQNAWNPLPIGRWS